MSNGVKIIEVVISKAPELLFEIDELLESSKNKRIEPEITLELIKKMVDWDRSKKRLKPHHFGMMCDIVDGKEELTSQNKNYCLMNLQFLSKYGFTI